ncbi:hypothetical protein EIP86_009778 [Pleurotus ostreatoroseus]|nr:hypothetical protein EIP86_009778 [Pleurotus ostreatoroseus]
MHDKSSAWLGLISSLSVLSSQRKLVTDLVGVLIIALYLMCILVVHTTLPATFSVGITNVTVMNFHPTILARQSDVRDSFFNETFITPLHAILALYDTMNISTIGVSDSTIYDIVPVIENTANAGVLVNATTISVDCGPIPDVVQTGFDIDGNDANSYTLDVDNNPTYDLTFGGGKYTASISPILSGTMQIVAPYEISNGEEPNDLAHHVNPSMLLIAYTDFPIVDSTGSSIPVSRINIDPPWQEGQASSTNVTTRINILGCNFATKDTSTEVNAQSRAITKSSAASKQSIWHDWIDPGVSQDPLLAQPLMYFASNAGLDGFSTDASLSVITNTSNVTVSSLFTTLNMFLYVDLTLAQNITDVDDLDNVPLADINHSLAKAYAAVLWYNNVQSASIARPFIERQQGEALVPTTELQVRIIINMFSLALGLGSSCVLLVIFIVLIYRTRHVRKQDGALVESTGLLPMLWLLGNEPSLKHIHKPDIDALRVAGMHEIAPMKAQIRADLPSMNERKEERFSQRQGIYISLAKPESRESYSSSVG